MRILVLGGDGYLGWPTALHLSRAGHEVGVADNFARLKEFGTLKVLLQQEFEVAEAFDITSTPTAVLVSADGSIRSDLAMGAVAIKQLFSSCAKAANSQAEDAAHSAGNVPAHH